MSDKIKQEEMLDQIVCSACESRKLYLIGIDTYKNRPVLKLWCNSCGFSQSIILDQGLKKPITNKKKELNYTG